MNLVLVEVGFVCFRKARILAAVVGFVYCQTVMCFVPACFVCFRITKFLAVVAVVVAADRHQREMSLLCLPAACSQTL